MNCFHTPILPARNGLLDLVVFFLLIYLSPGAGLLISSGQTGWHIILTVACSFWKKIPINFGKVFGSMRVLNHLPTIFSTCKRKRKNSAQHIILSQTVSDQNSRSAGEMLTQRVSSEEPWCLRSRSVVTALSGAAPLKLLLS